MRSSREVKDGQKMQKSLVIARRMVLQLLKPVEKDLKHQRIIRRVMCSSDNTKT